MNDQLFSIIACYDSTTTHKEASGQTKLSHEKMWYSGSVLFSPTSGHGLLGKKSCNYFFRRQQPQLITTRLASYVVFGVVYNVFLACILRVVDHRLYILFALHIYPRHIISFTVN